MDNILPENEFVEIEGRQYLNPQVGVDESNTFIEKLRAAQGQQNQEITQQTQRLGTDVPTNLGGLTGAESYFTSRYQTPQTNAAVSSLRAAAQAQALSEVLANEEAMWKKRYQDAYRNYQKRQYGSNGGDGGNGGNGDDEAGRGAVEEYATDENDSYTVSGSTTSRDGLRTIVTPDGVTHIIDDVTGEELTLRPGEGVVQKNSLQTQSAPLFAPGVPVFENGMFTTVGQFTTGGGR